MISMAKKGFEDVDSSVEEANIAAKGVKVDNPKPTVQDVLLAKTQVDLEVLQIILETHKMVKELYEAKDGSISRD